MPHQCLQCGHVFEDGSSQMLKGCPGCGGNRFFFTKQPLNAEEREIISKQVGKDIPTKIMELAVEKNTETQKSTETWITIKPKDLRAMIEKRLDQEKKQYEPPVATPLSDEERQAIIKKIKAEGLSILLVEQNFSFALRLADYVYVMNRGVVVYESSPEELRQNSEIKSKYLGV